MNTGKQSKNTAALSRTFFDGPIIPVLSGFFFPGYAKFFAFLAFLCGSCYHAVNEHDDAHRRFPRFPRLSLPYYSRQGSA